MDRAGILRQSDDFPIYPCFMPEEDCVGKVVEWIQQAKESILVQAYSFSNKKLADALIEAKKKGVTIKVLVDKDASIKTNSLIDTLYSEGIEINVDEEDRRAHNKVMILDNIRLITGSYNWTDDRFYYDTDSMLFIHDKCVSKNFKDNFDNLSSKSEQYITSIGYRIRSTVTKLHTIYRLYTSKSSTKYDLRANYQNSPFGLGCLSCSIQMPLDNDFSSNADDGFKTVQSKQTLRKIKAMEFCTVKSCFTPGQDCIKLIYDSIKSAKKLILVQACSLTHKKILNALVNAHERKVEVNLLIDEKALRDEGQTISNIIQASIPVMKANVVGIAHSKIIIIDDNIVITGSMNLTRSAQSFNSESMLHIKNKHVNIMYKLNWIKRCNSAKYVKLPSLNTGFQSWMNEFMN